MYNEFYGFSEDPFLIIPDPNYLYMSTKHEEALARLVYGLKEDRAIMLLTGEVGSGKTTLIKYLLGHLPQKIQTALITNPNLSADQLLDLILLEFEIPQEAGTGKSAKLKSLQTFLSNSTAQGEKTLLVIDEAQNLPQDALEEIRMLSNFQSDNRALLQIILVGQPELRARLKDPRYLQLAQRIALNYHIAALNLKETQAYIFYRLEKSNGRKDLFTEDALELVFRISGGIPRSINLVCDSSLIYGFSEEMRTIDRSVVSKAVKQLDVMGLVRTQKDLFAQGSGGNGGNQSLDGSTPNISQDFRLLMGELQQVFEKIQDRADSLDRLARYLLAYMRKVMLENRSHFKQLKADSAKLEAIVQQLEGKGRQGGDDTSAGNQDENVPSPQEAT